MADASLPNKLVLIPDHVSDIDALTQALGRDVVPLIYGYNRSARDIHKKIVHALSKYKRDQFVFIGWVVFPSDESGTMSYRNVQTNGHPLLDEHVFFMIMDVLRVYARDDAVLHLVAKVGNRVIGDRVFACHGDDWMSRGVCRNVAPLFDPRMVAPIPDAQPTCPCP
jgi:hypothetical protein